MPEQTYTEDDLLPEQVYDETDFVYSEDDFVPEEKAARYRDIAKAITDSSVTAEVVSGITAKNIPDEDKDLFLGIVQHQARETGANQKSSYLGKMGAGFAQGAQRSLQNIADVLPVMNQAIDFAAEPVVSGFQYNDPNYPMPEPTTATRDKMPAASSPKLGVLPEKFMGYESLSPKERAYRDAILAARNTGDPLRAADDTGWPIGHPANWPIEAAQMAPQMATGMGATAVAGPAGGVAYWATQTYPERMADLVKSGIDEKIAGPYALVDAALEGAVEMFEPFPGTSKLTGAAKAGIRAKIREFALQYLKEGSEEGVQGFLEEATKYVTSRLDPNAENSEAMNLIMTPIRQMAQAAGPLVGIMGTSRGLQALGNVGQRDGGDTNELMSMIPPREPTPEAPTMEEKPPIKLEITPEAKAQEEAIDAANPNLVSRDAMLSPEYAKELVASNPELAKDIAGNPSREKVRPLLIENERKSFTQKDRESLAKNIRSVISGVSATITPSVEYAKSFVAKFPERASEILLTRNPTDRELPEFSTQKDREKFRRLLWEQTTGDIEGVSGTSEVEKGAAGRAGTEREEVAPVVEASQTGQGADLGVSKEVERSAVAPEVVAAQLPLDNNRGKEVKAQGQGRQEGLLAQPGANAPSAVPSAGGVALPKQKRPSRVAIKDDMRGKVLDLAYKSAPLMGEPGIGEFAVGDDLESETESSVELPRGLLFPNTKQGRSWYRELRELLPQKAHKTVRLLKKNETLGPLGSGEDMIGRYGLKAVLNSLEASVDEDSGDTGRIKRFLDWVRDRDNAMSLSPADLYEVQRYRAYIESDSPEGMKKARLSKPQEFASENMVLGDSFTVGGHKHVVTEVDPETDSLVITNGQEMRVPIGQSVFIDVGSYRKATGETSDVFDVSPVDEADKERREAWDAVRKDFKRGEQTTFSGIDPKMVFNLMRAIRAEMKYGVVKFSDFVKNAAKNLGYEVTRNSMDVLRRAWESSREFIPELQPSKDSIDEALKGLPSRSPNPEKREEPQTPKPPKLPKKPKAAKGPVGPITALKKAVANVERADLGLNLLEDMKREGWQEVLDAAVGKESQAPTLVQEQILSPRALNTGEFAILLRYKVGLQRQLRDSAARLTKAIADRDNATIESESPEFVRLQAEAEQLSAAMPALVAQFDELTRAIKKSGTITARALAFMKATIDEDFTVQSVLANFAAKKGAPLTQEEVEKATKIGNDLEAAAEKKARTEAAADDLADDAVAEAEDEKAEAEEAKKPKAEPVSKVKKLQKEVRRAGLDLFASTMRSFENPDPEIFVKAIKLVRAYIKLKVVEFAEFIKRVREDFSPATVAPFEEILQEAWTQVMTERRTVTDANDDYELARVAKRVLLDFARAGVRGREELWRKTFEALQESVPDLTRRRLWEALTDYGKIKLLDKEQAKIEARNVRAQIRNELKLEDMAAGIAPKKTGIEYQTPDVETRRLIKLVNEAKKKGGYVVTDPERQLQSFLQTTKTRLQNRLADLQLALRTKRRIVREKRTFADTKEIADLRVAVAETQEEYDEVFGVKKMSDEQRVKVMAASLEKRIAEQERMIAENDIAVKPRKRGPTSPELEARREYSRALMLQIQELRRLASPKMTKEQIANAAYRARLAGRWADLVTRLFRNDFAVVKKAKLKLDTESAAADVEMDKLKKVYYDALRKYKWDHLSTLKKSGHIAFGGISVARLIQLGTEFSSVGNQGGFFVLNLWNGKKSVKFIGDMLKGLVDPVRRKRAQQEIENDPMYDYAKSVGKVAFSDPHGALNKQEEALLSPWIDSIPVLRELAEVNSIFLNAIRLEQFKQTMKSIGVQSDADAVAAGKFTNASTGRSDLGRIGNAAAPFLTILFLAARWTVSRFQMAALTPLYTGTPGTRWAAAKAYGQALTTVGLLYSAAAMIAMMMRKKDDDEPVIDLDPRSSHFGAIRFGNTWVSAFFGVESVVKFMSRLALGETIDRNGNIVAIREHYRPLNLIRKIPRTDKADPEARSRVFSSYLRQRLSPAAGAIANLTLFDKTIGGDPVTLPGEALGLVTPITGGDIVRAMKADGVPEGAALGLLAMFGMRMQTWEDEPGAVSDKIAKGLIKYNYRHGEKAAYVPTKPKKSYMNKAGEEVPFTDEQHEQLVRVSSKLADEFAAQRNVNFADPTDSDVEAIKESVSEAHRVAIERMVDALEAGDKPTDEELSGAVSDRMEADIIERMNVLASEKPKFSVRVKPDPLTGEKRTYKESVEIWEKKQAKARQWMKDRNVNPTIAKSTYRKHLLRNTKDSKTRGDNLRRASRNLAGK